MWVASQVLRDSTGRRFLEACARFPPGFVAGTFCLLLIFLYILWLIISVSATIYQPLLFLLANYQTPPNSCIQISIILVNLTEVTIPLLLTQDLLFLEAWFQAMVPPCFQFPNLIILESKRSHLAGWQSFQMYLYNVSWMCALHSHHHHICNLGHHALLLTIVSLIVLSPVTLIPNAAKFIFLM